MVNAVEQKAVNIVLKYEKKQGRKPINVSRDKCGYDIKSDDRFIEVKGTKGKKAGWFLITNTIVRTLGKNLSNYYVYIVYDINENPKLKILDPDDIFKNLKIDTNFLIPAKAVTKYGKDVAI